MLIAYNYTFFPLGSKSCFGGGGGGGVVLVILTDHLQKHGSL